VSKSQVGSLTSNHRRGKCFVSSLDSSRQIKKHLIPDRGRNSRDLGKADPLWNSRILRSRCAHHMVDLPG
jgi:hypothetical protein